MSEPLCSSIYCYSVKIHSWEDAGAVTSKKKAKSVISVRGQLFPLRPTNSLRVGTPSHQPTVASNVGFRSRRVPRAFFPRRSPAGSPLEPQRAAWTGWAGPEPTGFDGKGVGAAWSSGGSGWPHRGRVLPHLPALPRAALFSDLEVWGRCSEAPSVLPGLRRGPSPSSSPSSGPGCHAAPPCPLQPGAQGAGG